MDILWIVAAFVAGLVARALRLPTLVGYLAAGLGLAQTCLEREAAEQASVPTASDRASCMP